MQYISTRGGGEPKTYSEALLEGLAVDVSATFAAGEA